MRRTHLTSALLTLAIFLLAACGKAPLHHQESFVFGTRVEILVAGLEEARARPAASAVLIEFDRLHRTYHAWLPSELSELNSALAEGKSHPVTAEMAALLGDAQRRVALHRRLFAPRQDDLQFGGGIIQRPRRRHRRHFGLVGSRRDDDRHAG